MADTKRSQGSSIVSAEGRGERRPEASRSPRTIFRKVRMAGPPEARALFRQLKSRAVPAEDAELDRLRGRIRALRAKTVEQGCTEEEALAAAEKVADLLDRYGLSLSELELRHQPCEGFGIDTGRKRSGPLDTIVPAIAEFLGVPYTASDPLTLCIALHKGRTKELLAQRGVPTAPFVLVESPDDLPRLRGVMSPDVFRDDDLRILGTEWKANVIRWQITRNWGKSGTDRDLAEYDRWLDGRLNELDQALA
ncbi:MAG: DUF2786 domain-containing protein, partial [Verrucomicrobiota bacterium]